MGRILPHQECSVARIDYGMAEWTETMLRDVARQRPGGNVYKVKRGTQPASTKSPARSHDGHPIREEIWAEKIVNGNPQVVVKLQVVAKLVAAMTMTPSELLNPSSSTSSWLSVIFMYC